VKLVPEQDAFCNFCREVTPSKENDCQKCGLVKPYQITKFEIVECREGWALTQTHGENVWPTTVKGTARELIARLMQLMKVGPVAPQTEPETVVIEMPSPQPETDEVKLTKKLADIGPMKLEDKMKRFPTVHGDNCLGCGNPWFFDVSLDELHGKQCTTCGKIRT